MQIKELSLDKIAGSVYQPRQQPLARDRRRLARSILQNGLQVPIIVMHEQGKALLVCGHRRVDALQALRGAGHKALPGGLARISRGKVMVQAVDLGPVSRRQAALTGFIENDERVGLTPYENASCYKAFIEAYGFTQKELAERLKVDRGTLGNLLRALDSKNLTPAMIKAWKARELKPGHVLALLKLSDRRPDQVELFRMIRNEELSPSRANLWCERTLTPPERRQDRRQLDGLARAFWDEPALKEAFEDKELSVQPSRSGSRMDLRYSSVEDLEAKLEVMLDCLRRFGAAPVG